MGIKVARQKIEDADHVRIYHSRLQLASEKKLPIIVGHANEIANWCSLHRQESFEETQRVNAGVRNQVLAHMLSDKEPDHPVVTMVRQLVGVEFALATTYQLIVFKGRQFEWEEFEQQILTIMSTFNLDLDNISTKAPIEGHGPITRPGK